MRTFVIGVGMSKFEAPGNMEFEKYGVEAMKEALQDSKLKLEDINSIYTSYVYGESCSGQKVVNTLGRTGVPIINLNNNCCSGSTAIYLANQAAKISDGPVMALGFEVMQRALSNRYVDRPFPMDPALHVAQKLYPDSNKVNPKIGETSAKVIKLFEAAILERKKLYGIDELDSYIEIAYKNHLQGVHNTKAAYPKALTREQITNPKLQYTRHIYAGMSSPLANGSACAILASEAYLNKNPHLIPKAVEIIGQSLVSDVGAFGCDMVNTIGIELAQRGCREVFSQSGKTIRDVDVIEMHDCFSAHELMMYEAFGLVSQGKGVELVKSIKYRDLPNNGKQAVLGNRWVVNPSGGLETKGHPLGATGLAQCYELCKQLRSEVEEQRQVPNAKVGLQHNLGIGSACVITLYQKADMQLSSRL